MGTVHERDKAQGRWNWKIRVRVDWRLLARIRVPCQSKLLKFLGNPVAGNMPEAAIMPGLCLPLQDCCRKWWWGKRAGGKWVRCCLPGPPCGLTFSQWECCCYFFSSNVANFCFPILFSFGKNYYLNGHLSVRAKTIKFLGENIGVHFCDLGLGNDFLCMIPKTK